MEVNPDEMIAYLINQLFDNLAKENLRDVLSKSDYNRYSQNLSKKFNKPADRGQHNRYHPGKEPVDE